jgi:predicted PurR-regulated permease PerM
MSRENLFAAFFFVAFVFLLYQFYRILSFFLGPLSWAALLALVFHPLHRGLRGLLRRRETLSAFLITAAVILIVIVPTISLTAVLARQSVELYQRMNDFVGSGHLDEWIRQVRESSLGRLWQSVTPMLENWNLDLPTLALRTSDAVSAFLVAQAPQAAANVARFVTNFFLTTIALFFFFRDGERMVGALRELIPMEPDHKDAVLARLYEALSAVVQGSLVTALVQGILAGVGYWGLSVPFALLLGCATALLSLLPFGAPVVWLSVVIYLGVEASYTRALILLVWGAVVVSSADNLLRPLIIGGRTQIPTIFLFFGILGGLQAYGFLGVFLGPALIAILVAFVRIYREEYGGGPVAGSPTAR